MIALRDDFPLVQFPSGRSMAFERPWLARSLARAACEAGYDQWWLTGHVTESVAAYLAGEFTENTVAVARLDVAVRSVLQVIGYPDVANHYVSLPPPVRVSLTRLARQAGCGYELAFFGLLRDELKDAVSSGAQQIELEGLAPCVKLLCSAKNWRRDCSGLRSEIVGFVRGEIRSRTNRVDLCLQMS